MLQLETLRGRKMGDVLEETKQLDGGNDFTWHQTAVNSCRADSSFITGCPLVFILPNWYYFNTRKN